MKYKRMISLLLYIVVVCSMLIGCQVTPSDNFEPSMSTVPSTSPSLELSDTLKQICDLGIAGIELLSHANEVCSRKETVGMLAKIHELQYGTTSKYLAELEGIDQDKETTRYYFAQALYFSAMESFYDVPYENYDQWADYCSSNVMNTIWPDSQVIAQRLDGTVNEGGIWDFCPDLFEIENPIGAASLRCWIYDR